MIHWTWLIPAFCIGFIAALLYSALYIDKTYDLTAKPVIVKQVKKTT